MQKLIHNFSLLLLLFSGLTVASCSNDDDDDELPPLSNEAEYNNERYSLTSGVFLDLGAAGLTSTNPTHYGRTFIVANQDLTGITEPSLVLVSYFFSPGSTNFQTGTFGYLNVTGNTSIANKYFFTGAEFLFDVNKNGTLDDDDTMEITGGTMTLSGTEPNYVLTCDVTLANGQTLKAQYTGIFQEVSDQTPNARKGTFNISSLPDFSYKFLQR